MPSQVTNVPLIRVYDYLMTPSGPASGNAAPRPGRTVTLTPIADANSIAPVTQIPRQQPVQSTVTDNNGYWEIWVVPTDNMTPSGMQYLVDDGYHTYKINPILAGIPGIGWQSSAITTGTAAVLTPAGQTVTNLTVSSLTQGEVVFAGPAGLLTDDPGLFWDNVNKRLGVGTNAPGQVLDVNGIVNIRGAPALILMQGAGDATIVGGSTAFVIANNANNQPNMRLNDAGLMTVRAGVTISTGNLVFPQGTSQLIQFTDASATPNKYIEARNGALQVYASDGGTVIMQVDNFGNVYAKNGFDAVVAATALSIGASASQIAIRGPGRDLIVNRGLTVFGAGAQTLTAAQLLAGLIAGVPTAAVNYTTDTGANIDAAVTSVASSDSFMCWLLIEAGFAVTIVAGAGVTIVGNAVIPGNKNAVMIFRRTGVGTWSLYPVISA